VTPQRPSPAIRDCGAQPQIDRENVEGKMVYSALKMVYGGSLAMFAPVFLMSER
jgi:hypothetical protein